MKISTIAPLVEAVAQVGERLLLRVPNRGELSVTPQLVTNYPINIVTGIVGDIEGVVLFGLTRESALAVAEAILEKHLRVVDQSVSIALKQFGEMILSQDLSALRDSGVDFQLIPPAIIRGTGINVPTNDSPTLIIPLHFEGVGPICVKVSIFEKSAQAVA
jgi:chemotaxis protein CheX